MPDTLPTVNPVADVPTPAQPDLPAATPPVADDLPPEVDDVLASEPGLASVVVLERDQPRPKGAAMAANHGYLVTALIDGERRTYLVIGTDIARAARRAQQLLTRLSPTASILELCYHAEMLA